MLSAKIRPLSFLAVTLTLLLLLLGLFFTSSEQDYFRLSLATQCERQRGLSHEKQHVDLGTSPLRRKNIAIASSFGYHHDVYMAVAWTIERVIRKRSAHGHLQVYANTPFNRYGFQVIEKLGLYHGTFRKPEELIKDLLSGMENYHALNYFPEVDLRQPASNELIAAWDTLAEEKKFKLDCIVHNLADDVGIMLSQDGCTAMRFGSFHYPNTSLPAFATNSMYYQTVPT
ncbi:hypothetical protein CPB85DRAFT_1431339 [Mucidula mucida]|nr:hypothetical protein CPB85DRAFT_1431339 [Mucidula mucida]